ncbi:fimbrial protein [Pseudomonas sp. Xaverov 259]|uniref:fimbrial protein n=1 Tax=Pseudomonas sp. Xaverov 259 TaxID=2666086 RepID=UPI001C5B2430|nr:fimbrial protein [Pseudomonas sp. Xaverov 259]
MNNVNAIILTGLLLVAGQMGAHATDATITVNGRVVARPCTVSTPAVSVVLGDFYTSDYIRPGSSSSWYPFSLRLINCPTGTSSITATFTGPVDDTGFYENQGGALNLQLELQEASGNSLSNGKSTIIPVVTINQSARLSLKVRALSVKGNARQGSIQALINVTYTYS